MATASEGGVVVPLAARRASRTCFEGAMSFEDDGIDARTGASIRGSSMAALLLRKCCGYHLQP